MNAPREYSLAELADRFGLELAGDAAVRIGGVGTLAVGGRLPSRSTCGWRKLTVPDSVTTAATTSRPTGNDNTNVRESHRPDPCHSKRSRPVAQRAAAEREDALWERKADGYGPACRSSSYERGAIERVQNQRNPSS